MKRELLHHGIQLEEFGGDVQAVEISGLKVSVCMYLLVLICNGCHGYAMVVTHTHYTVHAHLEMFWRRIKILMLRYVI